MRIVGWQLDAASTWPPGVDEARAKGDTSRGWPKCAWSAPTNRLAVAVPAADGLHGPTTVVRVYDPDYPARHMRVFVEHLDVIAGLAWSPPGMDVVLATWDTVSSVRLHRPVGATNEYVCNEWDVLDVPFPMHVTFLPPEFTPTPGSRLLGDWDRVPSSLELPVNSDNMPIVVTLSRTGDCTWWYQPHLNAPWKAERARMPLPWSFADLGDTVFTATGCRVAVVGGSCNTIHVYAVDGGRRTGGFHMPDQSPIAVQSNPLWHSAVSAPPGGRFTAMRFCRSNKLVTVVNRRHVTLWSLEGDKWPRGGPRHQSVQLAAVTYEEDVLDIDVSSCGAFVLVRTTSHLDRRAVRAFGDAQMASSVRYETASPAACAAFSPHAVCAAVVAHNGAVDVHGLGPPGEMVNAATFQTALLSGVNYWDLLAGIGPEHISPIICELHTAFSGLPPRISEQVAVRFSALLGNLMDPRSIAFIDRQLVSFLFMASEAFLIFANGSQCTLGKKVAAVRRALLQDPFLASVSGERSAAVASPVAQAGGVKFKISVGGTKDDRVDLTALPRLVGTELTRKSGSYGSISAALPFAHWVLDCALFAICNLREFVKVPDVSANRVPALTLLAKGKYTVLLRDMADIASTIVRFETAPHPRQNGTPAAGTQAGTPRTTPAAAPTAAAPEIAANGAPLGHAGSPAPSPARGLGASSPGAPSAPTPIITSRAATPTTASAVRRTVEDDASDRSFLGSLLHELSELSDEMLSTLRQDPGLSLTHQNRWSHYPSLVATFTSRTAMTQLVRDLDIIPPFIGTRFAADPTQTITSRAVDPMQGLTVDHLPLAQIMAKQLAASGPRPGPEHTAADLLAAIASKEATEKRLEEKQQQHLQLQRQQERLGSSAPQADEIKEALKSNVAAQQSIAAQQHAAAQLKSKLEERTISRTPPLSSLTRSRPRRSATPAKATPQDSQTQQQASARTLYVRDKFQTLLTRIDARKRQEFEVLYREVQSKHPKDKDAMTVAIEQGKAAIENRARTEINGLRQQYMTEIEFRTRVYSQVLQRIARGERVIVDRLARIAADQAISETGTVLPYVPRVEPLPNDQSLHDVNTRAPFVSLFTGLVRECTRCHRLSADASNMPAAARARRHQAACPMCFGTNWITSWDTALTE